MTDTPTPWDGTITDAQKAIGVMALCDYRRSAGYEADCATVEHIYRLMRELEVTE
jgi:hypothetical protein